MDKVFIKNLKVPCLVGIYPHEREAPQELLLNITLGTTITEAARLDELSLSIDYEEMKNKVIDYIRSTEFFLLETLAEKTAAFCLEHPLAEEVTLSIEKVGIFPDCESVGIEITRRN
ncbi:dihydroneopterin aldolase [Spirochaeta cellobiosiphila]|uniref:dihydroneopterin aldolase n=1 Tax=Spirochaeta cellobiosiphila TaxID=504483 RepID=UPI00041F7DE5|nr:dihydroneopterin aldolase [Spirochaeta cellobiosiphila]